MNLTEICKALEEQGVTQVGFSDVSAALSKRYLHLPNAITLLFKLSEAVMDEVTEAPTYTYFQHYRTVNAFLDSRTLWLSEMLRRMGFKAFPIAASQSIPEMGSHAGAFQHKTAAHLAGLGWIGKSALFISKDYGAGVRLATVLTDMSLPVGEPMEQRCGGCSICVKRCPAQAIKGVNYCEGIRREEMLDAAACSNYMKTAYQHIGRGAVCGLCVSCCPV
jgi:ferredoxin